LSNNLGFIALNQGRLDEALACYQSGLALLERTNGSLYLQALLHASLGDTLIRRGDVKVARQHLQTSLDHCERIQARDFYPELYCLLAEAALLDDEMDEAEILGQRSLALTRELNMRGEEGRALRVLGEVEAAEEHDAPGEGGQGR